MMFVSWLMAFCIIIIGIVWTIELYRARDMSFVVWVSNNRLKAFCFFVVLLLLLFIVRSGDSGMVVFNVLPSNYTPPFVGFSDIINNTTIIDNISFLGYNLTYYGH